ncbi:DUF4383 domain-containing protein [Paenibacillus senegalensis]|uniref:DUF4383 domain-containing protein n=1 Tax=Paenibacillus senegalensis TaxID=1465766 RepID=UPI0002F1B285|nr:DUF4383 domain-containing protein [Paenibacillus senegalensis]
MLIRAFAKWSGIVFLLLGLVGFFIKELLPFFHFDTVHNVVHLVIGALGIGAASKYSFSVLYAKIIGIVYLILGAFGIFSPNMFGMMHLVMAENIFHLLVGALGTYLGFVYAEAKSGGSRAA